MISEKINRIKQEADMLSDSCVVVEGIKDKFVLEKIGFKNIFDISGRSLSSVVDLISLHGFKTSAVLTDFDMEGEQKLSQLTQLFRVNGIKIHTSLRKLVQKLFSITKIEELKYIIKLLEDGYDGKVSSINDKIFNRSKFHFRRTGGKARCYRSNIRTD